MSKVRVAIIGCGGIGNYHAEHLLEFDDVQVVAVADKITQRAQDMSDLFGGVNVYKDHKELYDNEDNIDAVYICIPPYARTLETEIPFIKRGCAMYIEKPMALDLELAREIRDAIAREGVINSVGFQLRYLNFLDPARAYIKEHNPKTVYANRIGGLPGVPWFNLYSQSGGQLVEQNIHSVDMLRYMFGDVVSVYGLAGNAYNTDLADYDIDDHSTCLLTFKSGVTICVNTGCYIPPAPKKEEKGLDLHTESATDAPNYNNITMVSADSVAECNYFSKFSVWGNDGSSQVFEDTSDFGVLGDRAFIDAVISGDQSKLKSPFYDAYKTLAVVLAANESFRTGEVIKI